MVGVSYRPLEAPGSIPRRRNRQDIYVYLLLLSLAGLQLALSGRSSEFVYDSYYGHHIRLIVVTEDGDNSYWKPSDSYCFRVLAHAYPKLFHEIHQGPHERVYELCDETQPADRL